MVTWSRMNPGNLRPLRRDGYLSALSHPCALGGNLGMFRQGDVYNPSLVGGHGLQGDGVSSGSHPLGDPCGEYPESVVAPFTVPLYVQDHPTICSLAYQQVGDELECPQCLAPAADEKP